MTSNLIFNHQNDLLASIICTISNDEGLLRVAPTLVLVVPEIFLCGVFCELLMTTVGGSFLLSSTTGFIILFSNFCILVFLEGSWETFDNPFIQLS